MLRYALIGVLILSVLTQVGLCGNLGFTKPSGEKRDIISRELLLLSQAKEGPTLKEIIEEKEREEREKRRKRKEAIEEIRKSRRFKIRVKLGLPANLKNFLDPVKGISYDEEKSPWSESYTWSRSYTEYQAGHCSSFFGVEAEYHRWTGAIELLTVKNRKFSEVSGFRGYHHFQDDVRMLTFEFGRKYYVTNLIYLKWLVAIWNISAKGTEVYRSRYDVYEHQADYTYSWMNFGCGGTAGLDYPLSPAFSLFGEGTFKLGPTPGLRPLLALYYSLNLGATITF